MHNVGKIDRLIRIIAATVLVILYFTNVLESGIFLFIALTLMLTSLRQCCPIYALIGKGTCGVEPVKTDKKIETEKLDLKK